ncbi:MAG: hypothetical protein AMJ60_06020, partial [Desulfobacterales bacterium SG8_35]
MKKNLSFCIILFLFLLLQGTASLLFAGQVTLEISTTASLSQGKIVANFRVTNKGTDPAHEVSLHGKFLQDVQSIFIAEHLSPGQSSEAGVVFDPPGDLQGTYPIYVTAFYQHANGTSVSSASLASVNIGSYDKEIPGLKISSDVTSGRGEVSIHLEAQDPNVELVTVTGHAPDDLAIEPVLQDVSLQEGRGVAKFKVSNISGNEGSIYGIFFAAEARSGGVNKLATVDIAMPVESIRTAVSSDAESLKTTLYAAFLLLAALLLVVFILSSRARQWLFRIESIPHILDVLVLLGVEIFIFSRFDLTSIFTATITTGGDTASHYYTLEYLRHTLLPAGKISGWTMGNYAGFPILQFYFPLPFLIMCLLDLAMPLQVAFKLVTLLGTALLPAAAYAMLRLLRCPFPGPGIGALLMLPFLFNPANSMWGGNILSTLAGEFSYSLSMALSLILAGSLYRGAVEDKWVVRNALMVFLVGFSHGYTLLFVEAMSLFLLITPYGFSRRVLYLFKVYALGFCLLAFWLIPLLAFTKYTTSYHLVWSIHSIREVVPEILLPVVVSGVGGSLIIFVAAILRYRTRGPGPLVEVAYLWFGLAAALVFFVAAPRIGVVDIRYVPYGQLMLCLMAAYFLGWAAHQILNRWKLSWILPVLVAAGVMHWTGSRTGPVSGWFTWNYEGFEAKKTWATFERINKKLEGNFQDPRVVFEHSQDHNMFGSSRAFESLPLFAGRATLEGLYMQASISAPFVFYIQTLVSRQSSQPFPQYSYTTMDFSRARRYLALFNVSDLILRSSGAKDAIRQVEDYSKTQAIGQYEIWHLTSQPGRYVQMLQFEPVVYQGSDPWKQVAYQWFGRDDLGDVNLVFNEALAENRKTPFKLGAASLDAIPRQEIDTADCTLMETIRDDEIFLETNCPGKPHLIKVSYHPNWQVEGAEKIYLVSPSFMLIYPQDNKVHLFYGKGPWDRLGHVLTLFGLVVLLLHIPLPGKSGTTLLSAMAKHMNLSAVTDLHFLPDPGPGARKTIMLTALALAVTLIAAGSYRTYVNEPNRAYNLSIRLKDTGQYEQARAGFRNFMETYPLTNLAQEASYYFAITYYLEKKDPEALEAFEEYLQHYPRGNRAAEVQYHIGLILQRSGSKEEGRRRMLLLIERHPASQWAGYARERLQEQGFTPSGEMIDINSSNLDQYMGRAISYFNRDRLDEAKPILRAISERFPDFSGTPQALAALALCYYKEDDCSNTINYYQKLIDRYPEHSLVPEAYFHLGLCFERLGKNILAEHA